MHSNDPPDDPDPLPSEGCGCEARRLTHGDREELDERTLLARLKAGDAAAFEFVVRAHSPRMLATAQRLLRHDQDAQDAVQDAFLSALRAISTFEGQSLLGTWLHRIVVNAALMRLRTRRRRPEVQIDALQPRFDASGHHADPTAILGARWRASEGAGRSRSPDEAAEERQAVADCLARLPEAAREVILLRDIEGLDTAETSRVLGLTEGAVKVRLHRARLALRALVAAG